MSDPPTTPVVGIAGWKNAGKTTLIVKLIAELRGRGYRVATVKHAHHEADVDREGSDSWRHREAGANKVALVTSRRWAVMTELGDDPEPPLDEILAGLTGVDLILVEGYKREPIPKIEVRRGASADPLPEGADIIAVATDAAATGSTDRPQLALDDFGAIADFLVDRFRLGEKG